jgi:hypothetical protein
VARYGADLRTAGSKGKSARTPTDEDFARGSVPDNDIEVPLGRDKAFAIRAEDATPRGQVHLHFARTNMVIHGQAMSQLQFFRFSSLGVIEFDSRGRVIAVRRW